MQSESSESVSNLENPTSPIPENSPRRRSTAVSRSTQSKIQSRKSRIPRQPSQRDLDIFKRVRVLHRPQWEVAVDCEVHYSRVSQIVRRVERWLAEGGSPTDPSLKTDLARRRLSRSLHKLRLLRAIELTTAAMEAESRPKTKTRRRLVSNTEMWREETKIDADPVDLRAVRQFLKANEALHAFEAQHETDEPQLGASIDDLLNPLIELLSNWRKQAEARGQVEVTEHTALLVTNTIYYLLGIGRSNEGADAQETLNLSADSQIEESAIAAPPTTSTAPTPPVAQEKSKT